VELLVVETRLKALVQSGNLMETRVRELLRANIDADWAKSMSAF
jgi:hypothetical protein